MQSIDMTTDRDRREATAAHNRAQARVKVREGKRVWQVRCVQCRIRIQYAREALAEQSAAARDRSERVKELQRRRVSASRARNHDARVRAKRASDRAIARARAHQRQATG
jgi:hypothetical protein